MNLTRYEQEVVINFNAEEATATVYTANPSWLRKMDVLAREFPDTFRLACYQFYEIASGTLAAELGCDKLFNSLPLIIQKEIEDKHSYFAKTAGLNNDEKIN